MVKYLQPLELAVDGSRLSCGLRKFPAALVSLFHWKDFIGKSLEAETAATAAIPDLYFHCKKSDAYIWQLSTGLVHFGTSRRSPRGGDEANQAAQQPQ
jgi:hypothetical protein